jgi:hypothetical protein
MRAVNLLFLIVLFIVAAATPSHGVDVFGRATTQPAWWQDLVDRETKFSAYQYLRLGMQDFSKDHNISVFGYGRYGFNEVAEPSNANGRLYNFYMDWRDVFKDRLDLKLGRQWSNLVAGSSIIDGVELDIKNLGPVGVVLLGGRDVIFGEFEEETQEGDTAWGGQVYLSGMKNLNLNLGYGLKYDEGDLARQTVSYDFGYNFKGISRVYSEARYDLMVEQISELLAGIKFFLNDQWTIRGEYFYTYPTFDSTSIYVVFAASQFQSGAFFVDYYISESLSLFGGYTAEYYNINDAENDNANLFELGTKTKVEKINLHGKVLVRNGYPGDLIGFSLSGDRAFLRNKLDLAAGIDYDYYKRQEMIENEIATKYWLAGRYFFSKMLSLALHVENTTSVTQDYNFAGWASFEVQF